MTTGCLNTTPGFITPDGRVNDPAHGTYFVRRDNPFLTGLDTLGVVEESTALGYSSVRTISPDGVFLTANPEAAVEDRHGWAWSDAPVSPTGARFFATLRFPRVFLPMGGEPVRFTMTRRSHRVRTEPAPPGSTPPAIGFDDEVLDTMDVALDPHVLLLPVRVHRFVPPGSAPIWGNEEYFQAALDRTDVDTISTEHHNGSYDSSVTVRSGRLLRGAVDVDEVFSQCDIQFRLEAHEDIQQQELARTLTRSCVCERNGIWGMNNEPLASYVNAIPNPETAIEVFVGGSFPDGGGCASDFRAATCGSSNAGLGGSCPKLHEQLFHQRNFVLLRADAVSTDRNVLAHEFGHFLGLTHIPNDGNSTCLDPDDTAGVDDFLMTIGAVGTVITPSQCARMRCIAAHWLERFGRIDTSRMDAICAE